MNTRPCFIRLLAAAWLLVFFGAARAEEAVRLSPALFKLETEKTVMHFFGSIHVGTPDMYPLPAAVNDSFRESTHLVVELNPLRSDAALSASVLLKKLAYPPGETIDRRLPPGYAEKLEAALRQYGLPFAVFRGFKPVVIGMVLTDAFARAAGYSAENGVDLRFLREAEKDGKPVLELESVDLQAEALGRIPDEAQVFFLTDFLDEMEKAVEDLKELVADWKRGDVEAVFAKEEKEFLETPGFRDFYEILVVERNIKMADRLKEMIARGGRYFVVVGAGHLAGPDSILELLKKDGFTAIRQ